MRARLRVYAELGESLSNEHVNPSIIEAAIRRYDEVCFQHRIAKKINTQGRFFRIVCSSRQTLPLAAWAENGIGIYIEVAPNAIASTFRTITQRYKDLAGAPCDEWGYAFLFILEHLWIHIVLRLFSLKIESFGKLASSLFGHAANATHLGCTPGQETCFLIHPYIASSKRLAPLELLSIRSLDVPAYRLVDNSCYIDSLLMIFLTSDEKYWRETILSTEVESTDYTRVAKAFPAIGSAAGVTAVAAVVQRHIEDDFRSLHAHLDSTRIRIELAKLLPEMRSATGWWEPFSASVIYDAIADLFPALATACPTRIVKDGYLGRLCYPSRNLLQMWDYLDPLTNTEGSYEEILWNELSAPVLVFQNGGSPNICCFDSVDPESVSTADGETRLVTKARTFGETILGQRYRLVGVVTLIGDSHYIAYIRWHEAWYRYDDTGPSLTPLSHLPAEGVWRDSGSSKPALFFYTHT